MLEIEEKDFKIIINKVKNQISNTKIEIFRNANMCLLKLYYNIGKIIYDNSEWGNKFIDEMACEIKISFPNIKGFSVRNLKSMKKYYLICSQNKKVQTASAQIPWSHNMIILDKIKDDNKRIWYMNETAVNEEKSLAGKAYLNIAKRIQGEDVPFIDLDEPKDILGKIKKFFKSFIDFLFIPPLDSPSNNGYINAYIPL